MTPIRSNPPVLPTAPQPSEPARLAAQKAFFALAAGQATAPAPAAQVAAPRAAAAVAPVDRAGAAEPSRPLRPGSLLDIRV